MAQRLLNNCLDRLARNAWTTLEQVLKKGKWLNEEFRSGFYSGVPRAAIGALLYYGLGFAPGAVSAPAIPFERFLAGLALHSTISKQKLAQSPIPADEPNLVAGGRVYTGQCAICHGLNGQAETAVAKGMFPHPPRSFHGHGVTDDPVGETYWKAANGIRMTGMPGFRGTLSNTELWQVSLMLANADKLPAAKAIVSGAAPGK